MMATESQLVLQSESLSVLASQLELEEALRLRSVSLLVLVLPLRWCVLELRLRSVSLLELALAQRSWSL